jgi:hypothetical protein
MEGGFTAYERLELTLRFELVDIEFDAPATAEQEAGFVDRLDVPLLYRELMAAAAKADVPLRIEVERVSVERGSILIGVLIVVAAVGAAISQYGSLRQGLDYLAGDLARACELFLGGSNPRLRPRLQSLGVGAPSPSAKSAPTARRRVEPLALYLAMSNLVLLLVLVGVLTVLLVRAA